MHHGPIRCAKGATRRIDGPIRWTAGPIRCPDGTRRRENPVICWRLIDSPPAPGRFNMALDAALMEAVRDGGEPVLRFYRWSPACLSLGRNQPAAGLYDEDAIRGRGIEVVRRPTGGRAVLHDRELTYSVVMPEGTLGAPRAAYATINQALVRGLRALGVDAALQPASGGRAAPPSISPCFREPAEGEVVVAGRKLVGSAQYREAGVTLQHGSLLLEGDQREVVELLLEPSPPDPADRPATLAEVLSPLPEWGVLVEALSAGWREVVGGALSAGDPSDDEVAAAHALARRFSSSAWTWRR